MELTFYTLLYVDVDEVRQLRGVTRRGEDRLKIFLRNAAVLDKSLVEFGGMSHLTILTNNDSLLERLSREIGYTDFKIKGLVFNLEVPKGIKFYSAHYKIDVFGWLGGQDESQYSILFDNDIVMLNSLPKEIENIAEEGLPMVYRLQGYGIDRVMKDTRKIMADIPIVSWSGGEFIGGRARFWKRLSEKCLEIAPAYFRSLDKDLFHIGDEMITNMALALLEREGLRVLDAGSINVITRYWGAIDKRSFRDINSSFVHLPADKVWLSQWDLNRAFDTHRLKSRYLRYLCVFTALRKLKGIIKR